MKTTSDINKKDDLQQIGVSFLDKKFDIFTGEIQSSVSLGVTRKNKLITAVVTTDGECKLLWFNIIETKL
jgi:hypothetical protein